jgi:general secretion pathway protein D
MKRNSTVFLAILLWSAGFGASLGDSNEDAAPPPVAAAPESGVPIETLVRNVAKKTGKRFVIDPRVHGSVQLIGEEPANVTYGEFLTVLQVEGFTAVESSSGLVRVIPEYIVRQSALPLVSGAASFPDAQYVAAVIPVQRIPAATLVPILRPLLPQQAHLAAAICSNSLVIVDTFANIRRIESLVAVLDTGDVYKAERCSAAVAHP